MVRHSFSQAFRLRSTLIGASLHIIRDICSPRNCRLIALALTGGKAGHPLSSMPLSLLCPHLNGSGMFECLCCASHRGGVRGFFGRIEHGFKKHLDSD